ncbi:MAG TPA: hypothetical protein VF074_17340, partial [Pyrinomonadaceae bacterium]
MLTIYHSTARILACRSRARSRDVQSQAGMRAVPVNAPCEPRTLVSSQTECYEADLLYRAYQTQHCS